MGCNPPGSPIPGILQARTLEWVAISFSNAWKWKVKVKLLSCVQLLATPWTAAYQAPPSMGFSRQEYWSGVPLPSPMLPNHLEGLKCRFLNPTEDLLNDNFLRYAWTFDYSLFCNYWCIWSLLQHWIRCICLPACLSYWDCELLQGRYCYSKPQIRHI